ncbi:MAG TPA: hypothetical protein VKS21_02195 [Spirochaetota bacterium]|nr:hypothetical protein [Spirochaetota bacterium]
MNITKQIKLCRQKFQNKKAFKLGFYIIAGLAFLITFILFLPSIIRLFIPLEKEAQKEVDRLDKAIAVEEKQYDNKAEELAALIDENEDDRLRLQEMRCKLLQGKINLFKLEKGQPPASNEIKALLSKPPSEPVSASASIYITPNEAGGWYYDWESGTITPNN